MPKKSREQKIRAAERLYESLRRQPHIQETRTSPLVSTTQTHSRTPIDPGITERENKLKQYFMADFKKSMLLIVSVIALEIFFYFASMSSNFAWLFKL